MASFQVKTGRKRPRRRKNKYYRTILFLPEAKQKIKKKIAKKFKGLKNTIMASFQAKIGQKMPTNREYKNYHSVSFQPDVKKEIKKKQQRNSNI